MELPARHQQRLQQRQRAEDLQQKRWQEMQLVKAKGKVLQGAHGPVKCHEIMRIFHDELDWGLGICYFF